MRSLLSSLHRHSVVAAVLPFVALHTRGEEREMKWIGFVVGLVVGTSFGYWLHAFWEGLADVGVADHLHIDLYLPLVLLGAAVVGLAMAKPGDDSRAGGIEDRRAARDEEAS